MGYRSCVFALVLMVSCFGAGCATRRSVLSLGADSTAVLGAVAEPLAIGDCLELELRDGSEARGFLCALTPDSLTLGAARDPVGPPGPHQPWPRAVALAEIRAGIRDQGGSREPLLLLEGPGETGPALHALPIGLGGIVYWRTRAGACGSGYFIALEPDTLVLADRRRWPQDYSRWHQDSSPVWPPTLAAAEVAGAVCRLAWVDLAELQYRDDHLQKQIVTRTALGGGSALIFVVLVVAAMKVIEDLTSVHVGPFF